MNVEEWSLHLLDYEIERDETQSQEPERNGKDLRLDPHEPCEECNQYHQNAGRNVFFHEWVFILGKDEAEGGAYPASHPPPIVLFAQRGSARGGTR